MQRDALERLSKAELIELLLRLQRPEKTSRTSSKPPSTDRKERRERAKPGGAKPGHAGHSRPLSDDVSERIAHRPEVCPCCRMALAPDLPAEAAGVWEQIELPAVRPQVVHHHRLAVRCPGCGTRAVAPVPVSGTPFGPRLHAMATYLKTYQALSYERLQAALADLFGLRLSQGGLMNLLRRAQGRFQAGREAAVATLRRAEVVASAETGVRIEGCTGYHWVFRCQDAVVHQAAPTRAASVVHAMMDGHRPAVWLSDRYSAQQGHGLAQRVRADTGAASEVAASARPAADLCQLAWPSRGDEQRLRARPPPRRDPAQGHQRLSRDLGRSGRGGRAHRGRHRPPRAEHQRLWHHPDDCHGLTATSQKSERGVGRAMQ